MIPVPSATHVKGDSAILTGIFNSLFNNLSRPSKRAPPPVNTIPFSTISAASSGKVVSNTFLVPSITTTSPSSTYLPSIFLPTYLAILPHLQIVFNSSKISLRIAVFLQSFLCVFRPLHL